jgi:RNA-binding protein
MPRGDDWSGQDIAETATKKPARAPRVKEPKAAVAPQLPKKRIMELRGLGHHLKPVLAVGKEGVSEAVVDACKAQLLAHELIKVKVQPEASVSRADAAAALASQTGAVICQQIGRTLLLFRPHPSAPKVLAKEKKSKKLSKGHSLSKSPARATAERRKHQKGLVELDD